MAPLRETIAAAARASTSRIAATTDPLRAYAAQYRAVTPDLSYLVPQVDWAGLTGLADALARLKEAVEAVLPGNWHGENLDLQKMPGVIKEGIPLAWVPPGDVIHALVAAPDAAARAVVLEANRDPIVDGCHQVLTEVTRPELEDQKRLLEEAASLLASGMHAGAQALAASVWDTAYRGVWRAEPAFQDGPRFKYDKVNGRLPDIDTDDAVIEFRQACVFGPFEKACESFFESSPVPTAFNRHATVHAAGPTQYTVANSLTALMLAASLLRELQEGQLSTQIHS
jgi:hypothetical protein